MNYLHNVFIVRRNFSVFELFPYHYKKLCYTNEHETCSEKPEFRTLLKNFWFSPPQHIWKHNKSLSNYSFPWHNKFYTYHNHFYLFCNVIQTSSVGWVTRPKVGVTTWPSTILTLNFLRIETSVIVAST